MIADSHCHAWRRWPYPPLPPDEDSRGRVEQLLYEMDCHDVEFAVLVSAEITGNPDNNDYGAAIAARYPTRLRHFVDVDSSWSPTYHTAGAAGRLRQLYDAYRPAGITHYLGSTNDGWLRSPEADSFFATAETLGVVLSLSVATCWQADLRVLAGRHPDLTVLCHHLGLPAPGSRPDGADLAEILASAAVPNIVLKASGFHYVSSTSWDHPWSDALALFRVLFEAYGPARLCWGSDFPASRRFCTYRQSLEVLRTHASFLSSADREAILGGTLAAILADTHPPA